MDIFFKQRFLLAGGALMLSASIVSAQDVPDGFTPTTRAPINRYDGNRTSTAAVDAAIKPYQASPEFPVNTYTSEGTATPTYQGGSSIHQGYVPSGASNMLGTEGSEGGLPSDAASTAPTPAPVDEEVLPPEQTKKAVLLFTDKVSARSQKVTVAVPAQASFQTLVLQVQKCQIASGGDKHAEHSMLLEVFTSEDNQGNPSNARIFAGWMFKNKASLTSLQHPYFDVALVECVSDPSTKPKPKNPTPKPVDASAAQDTAPTTVERTPVNADVPIASPVPALAEPKVITNPVVEQGQSAPIYDNSDAKVAEDTANRAVDSVTRMLENDVPVSAGAALPEGERKPINAEANTALPSSD